MTIFDFADKHPWWTFVYLLTICSIVPYYLRGWFRFSKTTVTQEKK